jgi:Tfp pilus assembly PilM family ATPase
MTTARATAARVLEVVPGLGRRSAITFDLGAAGLRAYQLRRRGRAWALCDALEFERAAAGDTDAAAAAPVIDPAQLSRLVGQGHFLGREVALVLSSPEVKFLPIHLPEQALTQPAERLEQALRWEVAQQSRRGSEPAAAEEVRYWTLPASRAQGPNIMAVVISGELVMEWCEQLGQHGLVLRRIDVSPCALVRLAGCVWAAAAGDLWGVLDLGLRHSTLTVVLGGVPAYIRSLSMCAHQWTQRLAQAFEIPYATAEHLKREQSLQATERGARAGSAPLAPETDLGGAFSGVLSQSLHTLAQEVGRCFSYAMHGFPDASVKRLFLAGGGATLAGLPSTLEAELGIPVSSLATEAVAPGVREQFLSGVTFRPRAAAALGAAILDLEAA